MLDCVFINYLPSKLSQSDKNIQFIIPQQSAAALLCWGVNSHREAELRDLSKQTHCFQLYSLVNSLLHI